MKRFIFYSIPAGLRPLARRLWFLPADLLDKLLNRRPEGIPPRGMIFVGHGDYVKQGEKFLGFFKEFGGLKPGHHVLDVGCGIGRMAVPLTNYLSNEGSYDGFDVVKSGIDWCRKNISNQYPNFRFQHIALHNSLYNTATQVHASSFVFPYDDEVFDFVFLTSVFTHMVADDTTNYIAQISRVMKPGAICFASFFLLNEESEKLMAESPTHMNFPYDKGHYRLHSSKVDAANVAYKQEWLEGIFSHNRLHIKSIRYGQWCGRKDFLDYQDIVILSKFD
jgi:ubiquinone/menaquinone biosynthesis C-methylase UbiE